ncbi:unnamed protein product [Dicrocoelium dendriticum]|nr:unnamed protein product [Dicrocoelium dendriticum]
MSAFEVAELAEEFDSIHPSSLAQPRLKYQEVQNGLLELTSADSITCLATHEKFLAIGTELGRVHILDHSGFPVENGVHSMHNSAVNQISVSQAGDFMVSCGDDGRVALYNLSDTSENRVFRINVKINAVAIAPDYNQSQAIVIGHTKLLLLSRDVFKRQKQGELATSQGKIRTVRWQGEFILWSDDARVSVYDIRDHQHIAYIQFREQQPLLSIPVIPCYTSWCSDTSFLLARGHCLRMCQVLERYYSSESGDTPRHSLSRSSSIQIPANTEAPLGLPSRYVEVAFQVDLESSLICGVSHHQSSLFALVVPNLSLVESSHDLPLEMRIIDIENIEASATSCKHDFRIHCERLTWSIQRTNRVHLNISLETVRGENTHFIVTPKEVICAQELTADDIIDWLISYGHYVEALQLAKERHRQLRTHTTQSLVPYLPIATGPNSLKLESALYEAILVDYMDREPSRFLELLSQWCELELILSYDNLLRMLIDRIDRHASLSGLSEVTGLEPNLRNLWQALAVLYERVGLHDKAIDILVQLRDPMVFDFFERKQSQPANWRLLDVFKERLEYFIDLDSTRAIAILIEHISVIPVEYVIPRLDVKPALLCQYLDSVHSRHPNLARPHISLLLELYTRFARDKLLPLLRSTESYPLNDALTICERARLIPETVYLLTRIGRRQDALRLIMTQGEDVSVTQPEFRQTSEYEQKQSAAAAAAIAYCCEEDSVRNRLGQLGLTTQTSIFTSSFGLTGNEDEDLDSQGGELWQQVVLFAVDKPAFIRALLQHADSEGLDPRLLLRKISPDMCIPGLKGSLITLMRNYRLQLELQRNCQSILRSDLHRLFTRLLRWKSKGLRVESSGFSFFVCTLCTHPLIRPQTQNPSSCDRPGQTEIASSCLVFRCQHVCHASCLPVNRAASCPICTSS